MACSRSRCGDHSTVPIPAVNLHRQPLPGQPPLPHNHARYDEAERLTSVTDAASHATNYGYNTESNLTSITDANGNETMFSYDQFGRVTRTSFPSSNIETYMYDANNNLTSKTADGWVVVSGAIVRWSGAERFGVGGHNCTTVSPGICLKWRRLAVPTP